MGLTTFCLTKWVKSPKAANLFSKKAERSSPFTKVISRSHKKRCSKTKETLRKIDCMLKIRRELLELVALASYNPAIWHRATL